MSQRFSKVWYATTDKISSMAKFVVFSDSGTLEAWPNEILFRGRRLTFPVRNIAAVTLTRQTLPWISLAIVNVILVAYLALSAREVVGFIAMLVVLVLANLCGILVGANTKWVRVEYQNEHNQPCSVYFADGSVLGWGGIFGGTKRLFEALQESAPKG